jgi:hypothetical protein
MSNARVRAGLTALVGFALGMSGTTTATAAGDPSPTVAEQAAEQSLRAEIQRLVDRFGPRLRHGPGSTSSHKTYRPKDGTYVESNGAVYRIAGGAPLHIGSWKAVGGPKKVEFISERQFEDLALWPKDGTFVTASDGRSYRFVGGAPLYISTWKPFGRPMLGVRIDAAAIAHAGGGGDWSAVNDVPVDFDPYLMDDFLEQEGKGTLTLGMDPKLYVRGAQSHRIYKIVGGAPLYISDWATVGGPKPTVTIDQAAIDRAGRPGPWRFLQKYPEGIRFLRGQTGQVFTVAGGAIIYVSNPKLLRDTITEEGESLTVVIEPARVDQRVLDRAGGAAPYDNLLYTPRDGTILFGLTGGPFGIGSDEEPKLYYVAGGVPQEIDPEGEESDLPGPVTGLGYADQIAIDRAGQPGLWSHLNSPPV